MPTELALSSSEAELTQANADVITTSARLCELLNLDPSTTLRPIEGAVVPEPIVPEPVPMNELIAIAVMQRPELGATSRNSGGNLCSDQREAPSLFSECDSRIQQRWFRGR